MKWLLLLFLVINSNVFALSCPSTGGMLNTGYPVEKVIQICGQPISNYTHLANNSTNEEWTYYKSIFGENAKLTLTFNQGQLTNIIVIDPSSTRNQVCQAKNNLNQIINVPCRPEARNVSTSGFCSQIIQVGNNTNYIRAVCGNPASQNTTSSTSTVVTELTYNGTGPNVLVFNENKLVDWKY